MYIYIMENIHLLTVGTHNEGYYDALKISASRNNYELETLGWGQKWEGFIMKFRLFMEKLNSLNDDEIVIMVDAYDVIVTNTKETVIEKFKKFNKPILLSREPNPKNIFIKYLLSKMYNSSFSVQFNGGLIMGYVWALKKLSILMCGDNLDLCRRPFLNDQELLINTLENNTDFLDKYIAIDYNYDIFYNSLGTNNSYFLYESDFEITDIFDIKNNKVYLKDTDTVPCFIHGPGNLNLNNLCLFYNLPIIPKSNRNSFTTLLNNKNTLLNSFADEIFKFKIYALVLLITLTILYIK